MLAQSRLWCCGRAFASCERPCFILCSVTPLVWVPPVLALPAPQLSLEGLPACTLAGLPSPGGSLMPFPGVSLHLCILPLAAICAEVAFSQLTECTCPLEEPTQGHGSFSKAVKKCDISNSRPSCLESRQMVNLVVCAAGCRWMAGAGSTRMTPFFVRGSLGW